MSSLILRLSSAEIVLSRVGQWRLPTVAGVITTPTIRPDGSILRKPGYDPIAKNFIRFRSVTDPFIHSAPSDGGGCQTRA